MKFFQKILLPVFTFFTFFSLITNLTIIKRSNNNNNIKNIVMNKIANTIQSQTEAQSFQDNPQFFCNAILTQEIETLKKTYKAQNFPSAIHYIPFSSLTITRETIQENNKLKYTIALFDSTKTPTALLIFEYPENSLKTNLLSINLIITLSFLILLIILIIINTRLLIPFQKFQEYPEKIAKGSTEKLPESKNKYFGKYIWAMNMLSDKLNNDHKIINKMILNRQTLNSTIAHGIKTPVTNIKLYSNAIQTGLYSKGEKQNKKDIEIAGKIEKNADDIQKLLNDLLNNSTKAIYEYEPSLTTFYSQEIKDFILTEYENKFQINHIPYEITITTNTLVKTDKDGIFHILYQLLDNAIKYGDGTLIKVLIDYQKDGLYISVTNNGVPVKDDELNYIFNSFWRGSNAGQKEGQGIGLFEARQISKAIGADLFVKTQAFQTEFLLFCPN